MKINLSVYAGFCDGVNRAYKIVMGIDIDKAKKPIFVLGSLVHNPEVIKRISERGIGKIDREAVFSAEPREIGTLIINAHGTGPDILEAAKSKGVDIVDTTCPKVIKVQRLAKVYAERGYRIVIVGDKDHKEVKGINDWGDSNAFVISEEKDLEQMDFDLQDKIVVLSQTTQNEDFFGKIVLRIKEKYKNAEIHLTTCHTTHNRQTEIKNMAGSNEVIIIIGSNISANSRRLLEIAKEINSRSYFVETVRDLREEWFKGVETVGVTAGASTPTWIIEEVLDYLSPAAFELRQKSKR